MHFNESTVLTGLHLSRISNPHITCKVNTCEMIYFCSGSSNLYLDLHRWYWPIRGCLERDSVCTWSILIRIHQLYDTCCIPLFKQHRPQLLLDHNHTMDYWVFVSGNHLCAPDSEWGFLLNLLFQSTMDLNNHWLLSHTNTLAMWP